MKLFSGGGRRGLAVTTGLFVGSLFTFIGVTAGPALAINPAVSSCASATTVTANDTLQVRLHADDTVALLYGLSPGAGTSGFAGVFSISVNHTQFVSCGATATGANVVWIDVVGSDQGNETFIELYPDVEMSNDNTTIDLGNGTDTFSIEYGGYAFTDATPTIVDPATNDGFGLGTAANGTLVGDVNNGCAADTRIDNAEIFTMNGGGGNDTLDASGRNMTCIPSAGTTSPLDNIPPGGLHHHAYAPFSANTTLNGGTGDDTLYSGDGNDNFQGGPGVDSVNYLAASGPVVVDLTAATGTGMGSDTLSDVQDATGGRFADTITGNGLDNTLSGRGGNDTIDGGAGADAVNGDNGNDTLTGGLGADVVSGGNGRDMMIAGGTGDGVDSYTGGNGVDTVDYSVRTAANYLSNNGNANSGEGTCPVTGAGCEGDTISTTTEVLVAGSGNDTLVAGSSGWNGCSTMLVGGPGNDSLNGNGNCVWTMLSSGAAGPLNADLVAGTMTGDGNDTIAGIHRFIGTSGNDTVAVDQNNSVSKFWGLGGIDTVDGSQATKGLNIRLTELGGSHGGTVENLIGGSGDDDLGGNSLANMIVGNDGNDNIVGYNGDDNLSGGAGDDSVSGGNGNDMVEGGLGNDSLSGGAGGDTLIYTHAPSKVTVDNQLGYAKGGDGSDSLAFFEIVKGSNFNDTIVAGQNSVSVNNRLYGRGGNDMLIGSNSTDFLNGGSGNDQIRAGGGDDIVKGSSGKDVLYGSSGDDSLSGGKGNDIGWGGSGNDSCHSIEQKHSC